MKTTFVGLMCSMAAGLWIAATPALAQQKTVKTCQGEWRANKAANQAKGITEKAYVDQCRGGAAAAPETPAATNPASAPASPGAAAPSPATPAATPPPARASKPTRTATPNPAGPNEFATEAEAKSKCPADTVVWANLTSKIYHFASYRSYGTTKNGAYMCEKDAAGQGFRASKNEKPPA